MKNHFLLNWWAWLGATLTFAQVTENRDYGVTIGVGATTQTESGPNTFKMPASALEVSSNGKIQWHFLLLN